MARNPWRKAHKGARRRLRRPRCGVSTLRAPWPCLAAADGLLSDPCADISRTLRVLTPSVTALDRQHDRPGGEPGGRQRFTRRFVRESASSPESVGVNRDQSRPDRGGSGRCRLRGEDLFDGRRQTGRADRFEAPNSDFCTAFSVENAGRLIELRRDPGVMKSSPRRSTQSRARIRLGNAIPVEPSWRFFASPASTPRAEVGARAGKFPIRRTGMPLSILGNASENQAFRRDCHDLQGFYDRRGG